MKPKFSQPNTINSSLNNYHSSRISQQEKQRLMYWRERYQAKLRMKNFRKNIFGEHYNHDNLKLNNQKKFLQQEEKNTEIQRSNRILLEKIKKIANRSVPKQIVRLRTQNSTDMTKPLKYHHQVHFDSQFLKNRRNMSLLDNRINKVNLIKGFTPQNKNIPVDNLQNQQSQQKDNTKITLYRGKRKIDGKQFSFSIFIQNQKYTILSENEKTQQKIQMPAKIYYQMLFKSTLENKHSNIFHFLKMNSEGILQIVGVKKLIKDAIQIIELNLPAKQSKNQQQKTEEVSAKNISMS